MKKILIGMLSLALLFTAACGTPETPQKPEPPQEEEKLLSVEEIMKNTPAADLSLDRFDLDKYLLPLWKSQIVYNETACFVQNADGSFAPKSLAFPIAKVLEVRDSSLKILYEEGKDYEITADGEIQLLAGTSIVNFAFDDFYLKSDARGVGSKSQPGRFLKIGDGGYFYSRQVCVSYVRTAKYDGPKPEVDFSLLPKTLEKLKAKQDLSVVYYGDSITTGSSVSGWEYANLEPRMPIYTELVTQKLRRAYGYGEDTGKITEHNTAVGGWTAENAKAPAEVTERVISHSPDLVVLAFGMNDGGGAVSETFRQRFESNVESIIGRVRQFVPDCEFVLVSTMLPNPDALNADGSSTLANHRDCQVALDNLVGSYDGVCNANMTVVHDWLLKRKQFHDMGDNLVHPTDFAARVYSQVILSHLIPDYL